MCRNIYAVNCLETSQGKYFCIIKPSAGFMWRNVYFLSQWGFWACKNGRKELLVISPWDVIRAQWQEESLISAQWLTGNREIRWVHFEQWSLKRHTGSRTFNSGPTAGCMWRLFIDQQCNEKKLAPFTFDVLHIFHSCAHSHHNMVLGS